MKRFLIAAGSLLVAAGITTSIVLAQAGPSGAAMPAVTTVASAYTVPGTVLTIAPQPPAMVAAQSSTEQSAARSLCSKPVQGTGCYSTVPDSLQYILFTDKHDRANTAWVNKPAYLMKWALKGKACTLGLGGPQGSDETTLAQDAVCTFNLVVDPTTNQQMDSWAG